VHMSCYVVNDPIVKLRLAQLAGDISRHQGTLVLKLHSVWHTMQ
jgi:hypothetical protein